MAEGIVREKQNIYYLLDTSAGMSGAKIQGLNSAMQELQPALEEAGIDNNVEIIIRVIEFGNEETARWIIGNEVSGISVDNFMWCDLLAEGKSTSAASAIEMVVDSLNPEYLGPRVRPPIIILITDGESTDVNAKYLSACNALKERLGRWRYWSPGPACIAVSANEYKKSELEEFATKGRNGDALIFEAHDTDTVIERLYGFVYQQEEEYVPPSIKSSIGCLDEETSFSCVPPPPPFYYNAKQNENVIQALRTIKDNHDEDIFIDTGRFSSIIRDVLIGDNLERMRKCLIAAIEKESWKRLEKASLEGRITLEISVLADVLHNQNGIDASFAEEAIECIAALFAGDEYEDW